MVRKILVTVIGGVCGATVAVILAIGVSFIAGMILGGAIGLPKFTGFDAIALTFWSAFLALPIGALYGGKRCLETYG
jgi:hypothetical protein